jgi:outer membrane protein assembly factor BamB
MSRRRAALVGAAALVVVGLGAGVVISKLLGDEDVRGSSTEEFVETQIPDPERPPSPAPGEAASDVISWPTFGYANERARISPYDHVPPFRRVWRFRGRALLEFPPAIAYGRLYVTNNSGVTFAVDAKTGATVWRPSRSVKLKNAP